MLWPGGEVDSLFKSGYGRAGKIFYELAKQVENNFFVLIILS